MLSNPTLTACGPCKAGEYADTKAQVSASKVDSHASNDSQWLPVTPNGSHHVSLLPNYPQACQSCPRGTYAPSAQENECLGWYGSGMPPFLRLSCCLTFALGATPDLSSHTTSLPSPVPPEAARTT